MRPVTALPGAADAWWGRDLRQDPARWIHELGADAAAELERAAEAVLATGAFATHADAAAVARATELDGFLPAFPRLAETVTAHARELLDGRGFVVIRGIAQDGGLARMAARLWALGALVGRPVAQNARGHLLGHVIDVGRDAADPTARLYQTNQRQGFHTDSADVVALLCVRTARAGGQSRLASAVTAYQEVARRAPALVDALLQPVATDHRGEEPPGQPPWFEIPVLSWWEGRLSGCYQRRYIESAQRFAGAPRLTAAQEAALDVLDAVLDDPDVHLEMELQPGDVQLVHNHQIFHDRAGFVDHDDPDRRRHLLRLWLCPPRGRELPPVFAQRYGSVAVGARGGVVPRGPLVISLDP